jgi:hypothetical protein
MSFTFCTLYEILFVLYIYQCGGWTFEIIRLSAQVRRFRGPRTLIAACEGL